MTMTSLFHDRIRQEVKRFGLKVTRIRQEVIRNNRFHGEQSQGWEWKLWRVGEISNYYYYVIVMYLYSAQYLHILQGSKRYLTNASVQEQPQLTSN